LERGEIRARGFDGRGVLVEIPPAFWGESLALDWSSGEARAIFPPGGGAYHAVEVARAGLTAWLPETEAEPEPELKPARGGAPPTHKREIIRKIAAEL